MSISSLFLFWVCILLLTAWLVGLAISHSRHKTFTTKTHTKVQKLEVKVEDIDRTITLLHELEKQRLKSH